MRFTVTLDLSSTITPSANFTVNAPSTIRDWQRYILRVTSWATAYTMTLWTNVTNPYWVDLTLTANWIDQFIFLAVWWNLELQHEAVSLEVVSDEAFSSSWDWITTQAPSKNAMYDVLWDVETLLANI